MIFILHNRFLPWKSAQWQLWYTVTSLHNTLQLILLSTIIRNSNWGRLEASHLPQSVSAVPTIIPILLLYITAVTQECTPVNTDSTLHTQAQYYSL